MVYIELVKIFKQIGTPEWLKSRSREEVRINYKTIVKTEYVT